MRGPNQDDEIERALAEQPVTVGGDGTGIHESGVRRNESDELPCRIV
jgi:hypothetical protein